MKKRIAALVLAVALTVLLQPFTAVAYNLDAASEWARSHIESALAKGFVPFEIQGNYTDIITRAEFCRMAVKWVEYATGEPVAPPSESPFSDTDDPGILAAYALGITAGTSPTTFTPNGKFTRQQAATMLLNACKAIGMTTENPPPSTFADLDEAADWARPGIAFVQANGIMQGTGNGNFSPENVYTIEQSITTFNNITYTNIKPKEPPILDEPEEPEYEENDEEDDTIEPTDEPGVIAEGVRFTGQVTAFSEDLPVKGAQVAVEYAGKAIAVTFTDSKGLYTFESIPPGVYSLVITADGFLT